MFSFALVFISLTVSFSLVLIIIAWRTNVRGTRKLKKRLPSINVKLILSEYATEIYKTKGLFVYFSY